MKEHWTGSRVDLDVHVSLATKSRGTFGSGFSHLSQQMGWMAVRSVGSGLLQELNEIQCVKHLLGGLLWRREPRG